MLSLVAMVEIEEAVVHRASGGDTAALSAVICACYPSVCRIAIAIGGDTERGLALVHELVRQSIRASEQWQDAAAPWRWFVHHAILNLRRNSTLAASDPLVQYSADKELPFVSFIRAVRKLPPQQTEAFILHHGEQFDARRLAVAMDCSTTAAANHLSAASAELKLVAAGEFDARLADFRTAYGNLSPDPEQVRTYVLSNVKARVLPRKALRWTKGLVAIAVAIVVVLLIAYAAWKALGYMSS